MHRLRWSAAEALTNRPINWSEEQEEEDEEFAYGKIETRPNTLKNTEAHHMVSALLHLSCWGAAPSSGLYTLNHKRFSISCAQSVDDKT